MEAATAKDSGFRYQPALDGVRALAVLAVLGFHFGTSAAKGGYLGVDIFLVLSGFLITSLLAIERTNTGRIDFLHFWGRRIRRLLPALLVLLVLVGLYAWLAAPDVQLSRIRDDGLATLFYVQNWHLVASAGQASPLSHTWSLAIEEQWYLIWPPVFLGLTWLCRKRPRLLLGVVLGLALVSASEMAWLGAGGRAYFGTDSRAQSLLLGAALALLLQLKPGPARRGSRVALEVFGLIGIVVFAAMVLNPPTRMYQGGFFVVAIAAATVIAASVQPNSPVLRPVLSFAPLRWLGLISYGVYLYHFLVLRWLNEARTGLSPAPLALVRFVVTIAVATASYFLIEMPVRRGTFLPRRAQIVLTPVAVALTVVIVLITTAGAPVAEALSRNEQLWRYERETAPPDAQRVLLVGGGVVFDVVVAMKGPFDGSGVRGLASGSLTCPVSGLHPPAGAVRSPQCAARWTELREAVRAYRPQTVVVMADAPASTPDDATRAIAEEIHQLAPAARLAVLAPPTTTNPPALVDADLRAPDGSLTPDGARAIWRWIVDDLSDASAP